MRVAETPNIVSVLGRIYVDDLDTALPLYGKLADNPEPHPFAFRDLRLAVVGPFLLVQGWDEGIRTHSSTTGVRDIVEEGGELLEGPDPGPNGQRLIPRHPDNAILEYIKLAWDMHPRTSNNTASAPGTAHARTRAGVADAARKCPRRVSSHTRDGTGPTCAVSGQARRQ